MERDGGELLSLKLFQWPPPLMLVVTSADFFIGTTWALNPSSAFSF